ncbi:MAG TPA: hypothetical protein VLA61_10210 [Ideonella sp.]|uniref:hypothetical protein n=1 Tax=Ideonella sp. TaxID=1929293 RepID=UPI002BFF913F|nr:hypothetical protein [Ideonella sp.]HSI48633.1 hypothetical protein [Ideonella sp.]
MRFNTWLLALTATGIAVHTLRKAANRGSTTALTTSGSRPGDGAAAGFTAGNGSPNAAERLPDMGLNTGRMRKPHPTDSDEAAPGLADFARGA